MIKREHAGDKTTEHGGDDGDGGNQGGAEIARKGPNAAPLLAVIIAIWIPDFIAKLSQPFDWLLLLFGAGLVFAAAILWGALYSYQRRTPFLRITGSHFEFYGHTLFHRRIIPLRDITQVSLSRTPSFIDGAYLLTVVSSSRVTTMRVPPRPPSVVTEVKNLLACQFKGLFFEAE
ncbi:hypothetical protein [Massilia horti]|uniref:PH domain-containing protein n=1 Tax=Massilia horti TaxID=2562153 RepID=A0A4Y9T2Q7_9BURK|nr:hypothetical protein [Massilia horti]TFW33727.1 hypothetical protein E4O92_05905 [Massilia horti]